ncbi:pre-toxin TG domain-containing protein [Priestia aryabhattai]|uniref:pre-toxin TG domain-containing protein n=1 Tax=Priestia aryabhattai TaxID=412384 RepID=UPI003364F477
MYTNDKKPEIARSVYEEEAKKQQQDGLAAVSFVADMVPLVSNVKGGWEASVGYDPITGNELSSFDRSVSGAGIVLGGFARVPGKVVKYGSEGAEYVLRVNKAEKTVTKHKVKDVSKGESKAVEKVEKPGGKANAEGVHDQAAVAKGTGKFVHNADDVVFKQSSIDKAFSKHRNDFGSYPDGSKSSVELFKNDVSELINTGVQKQGKYRNVEGTHIYNETTKQWTFINSDGTMNTAFKLSDSQYKYLIEKGVVK